MPAPCDVAIIGGGPAGSACALALRARAPALAITLVEASSYHRPRIGETLPPPAARVLKHLGVFDRFQQQKHVEAFGTAAAWGAPEPYDHEFIFSAHNTGWHLDRQAFDAMLVGQARARGVTVLMATRMVGAAHTGAGWKVTLSSGESLYPRAVVDATGSAAVLSRHAGARPARLDRLAGYVRVFNDEPDSDRRTLVEAFEHGWWYTAPLPNRLRLVACMTDADIGRKLELAYVRGWTNALASAAAVHALVQGRSPSGRLLVHAAATRRLQSAAGADWIAVGDAASTFDPLSAQGIVKAMRSGMFGAYAISALLGHGDASGLSRYRRFIDHEFDAYVRAREAYYALEARWPESEFWRRRHTEAYVTQ